MLIRAGRLVDPSQSLDASLDLRIREGRVAEIGSHLEPERSEECLDASGMIIAPGFIDMHVHLREPGQPEKETIATGTAAAARGGFTAVACMPNTIPAIDSVQTLQWIAERSKRDALVRVYPIAAMTLGRDGNSCVDFEQLRSAGAVAFSDDGSTLMDGAVQEEVARKLSGMRVPVIAHCEPEEEIVQRDIAIARRTGAAWHIAHISTGSALKFVEEAKHAGLAITCEATPHHLVFSELETKTLRGAARVHPPLRPAGDVHALCDAVRQGTIDALASDHAPHTAQEKSLDFQHAAPGFTGLEVAVGAYAYALHGLDLSRFVELLSTNPARILGVPGGTLRVGSDADVTLFSDREWVCDPAAFLSKGRCTPFAGMKLPRQATATIVGGRIVMREGVVYA